MNIFKYMLNKVNLSNLIRSNSGVSSKNFFLVAVTIVSIVLLSMVAIAILVDLWCNHTVTMSWSDMGMFVGAVSSMIVGAGIAKAWSEKYERLPGPDGILGTDDDVYIKKTTPYEYSKENNNNEALDI